MVETEEGSRFPGIGYSVHESTDVETNQTDDDGSMDEREYGKE